MKYTLELEINLPRNRVIELFDNPDNLKKWQPDLISFEHLSGEAGQVGAKSRLRYRTGKREFEMIETITVNKLPDEFSGTYEGKGFWNKVENRFSESGADKTKWVLDSEFKVGGIMKIMSIFMPGLFKKQSLKFMKQFKEFAENA